jgi:hypothetical protein
MRLGSSIVPAPSTVTLVRSERIYGDRASSFGVVLVPLSRLNKPPLQRYAVVLDLGLIACLALSWRVLRYPSRPSERRRSRGDPTALTTAVGYKKEGRGFRPRPSSSRLTGFASTVWLQSQSTYLGTPPATSCAGMVSTVSMSLVNSTYSSSISARGLKSGLAMMPCTRRRCMPMLPPS